MKSARERAEIALAFALDASNGLSGDERVSEIEALFKEYGRDQQNIDAVAARDALVNFRHAGDAYAAVMNSPAPGEEKS